MNTLIFCNATEIDSFITNLTPENRTDQWIISTYFQINWVEVFCREAKGSLGLNEYQIRDEINIIRYFILVFITYTFIIWHKLIGRLGEA